MKAKVGNIDKTVRLIRALLLGLILFFDLTTGILNFLVIILIVMLVVTSFTGFCGIYKLFGLNTCNIKEKDCD